MGKLLTVVGLCVLAVRADAQQCRADFDASGAVEIGEVIQAVNEALNGCGGQASPTPTRAPFACPVLFTDDNRSDDAPVCVYNQTLATCQGNELAFYTDGTFVIVAVEADVIVYYGARVSDATHAVVLGRWTETDLSNFLNSTGNFTLSNVLRVSVMRPAVGCDGNWRGAYDAQRYPPRGAIRAMFAALHAR